MSNTNEVVEAVAKKLFQAATDEPWDAASPDQDKHFRTEARVALASAWEEGCAEGLSYNPGHDDEALAANPYRTTK